MRISDEIRQEAIGEIDEDRDIFFALISGKTVTEEIETSRGVFTVKFPKQKDLLYIDRRVAAMRAGLPASAFDASSTFSMQKTAFLDAVVESGPDWFNKLRKKSPSFTWEEVPDVDFIDEVYVKAWEFREKVQAKFRQDKAAGDSGAADGAELSPAVDDGLFSGVAATARRD